MCVVITVNPTILERPLGKSMKNQQIGRAASLVIEMVFPTGNEVEISPFSKEEMNHFLKMLKSNSSSGIPSLSLAPIAGKGLIKLSENIDLKYVLHVPKIACNLSSVSKLTKEYNCCVILCDSYFEFQDRNVGKKIDSDKMIDGHYYFNDDFSTKKKAQVLSSVSSHVSK